MLRTALFGTCWYQDDHDELERLFQGLRDPWNFETSDYERERMLVLAREVSRYPHASILEVGCAEGVFTEMLTAMSPRVMAIDVSATAVSRAQARCPGARCIAVSLDAFQAAEPFDLVVCAETLYYVRDVPRAIGKLSSLGRRCLVSYIRRESGRLDGYFEERPGVSVAHLELGARWLKRGMVVATWTNA